MKLGDLVELRYIETINSLKPKKGVIVGFTGPMFSGKTTELIRMYERYVIGNKKSLMLKPALDKRYGESYVSTHIGHKVKAYAVEDSKQLYELIDKFKENPVEVSYNHHSINLTGRLKGVFIDEIQFFDSGIIDVIQKFNDDGIDVYWSGLNQDSRGKPFMFKDGKEHIGYLMAISDELYVLSAVCCVCGEKATKSYRKVNSEQLIDVGGADKYDARCKDHWIPK